MPTTEAKLPWALVLAGGDGKRLQDLTREITGAPIPKQYCRLLGDQSLLEATLARVQQLTPAGRTLVIANENHLELVQGQLGMVPTRNLLIQPCNRDTGPGLLFGLLSLARLDPNSTVAVFPSDHFVNDEAGFIDHVERAVRVVTVHPDKIAILGIQPDRPEPGFGYLVPAQPLAVSGAFHVAGFWEKPSLETAGELLLQKGLWNSFVMVFQLWSMLRLLQRLIPREFDRMCEAVEDPQKLARDYSRLIPWNFCTEIMTRISEHLVVLRVDDVHWSDWGTRESIERTLRSLKRVPPWLESAGRTAEAASPLRSAA